MGLLMRLPRGLRFGPGAIAANGGGVRSDILPGDGFGDPLSDQRAWQEFRVRILTIWECRSRSFLSVAGDFPHNTVEWQRFIMKVRLRLLAKCSAMFHLLTNPDPLLGFHVFKLREPGFILSRAKFCVVNLVI